MSAGVLDRAAAGARVTAAEALALMRGADLLDLGAAANAIRFRRHPEPRVTYVLDTNPNYTNVCSVGCSFCAFYRRPGGEGAFTYTVDELIGRFRAAAARGATTVLLQGGVNPALPFAYYEELVARTVREVPEVHPHFFSPPEVRGMAAVAGLGVDEVLGRLWDAGLRTLPGGGAEVLSDRVRRRVSPRKGTAGEWLEVMRAAHRLGYRTTATLMYGLREDDADVVEHLEAVRRLQDETGGFTAFIPWSFKPGNTAFERDGVRRATGTRYLQILALARICLDNVPHIQASWFSEGKRIGQVALHFGADDFGGTLLEENVHAAADFVNRTTVDEVRELIQRAGFTPVQRTTLYEEVAVTEGPVGGVVTAHA